MDYIKIKGFKSIKDTYIEIAPINILIGANGSGKSNFISFFDFIHAIYNLKLNEYTALKGGGDKILHKGKKITNELSFKIEFDSGNNGYEVNMKFGDDGFVITRENLIYKQDNWIISTSSNETKLKYSTIFRAKYIKNYLNGFRRYHFHDTGKNSPFSNYSNIENDSYFFYTDGSNIGAFLYKILNEDKSTYKKIIKNIKSIAPYFSDFYLVPNKEKT
ncbi:AAA family ATPase [Ornithobacterium rhinotracheale]